MSYLVLNLNDVVSISLTDKGKQILDAYLESQLKVHGCNASECYKDNNMIINIPLKDFIRIFGKFLDDYEVIKDNDLIIGIYRK